MHRLLLSLVLLSTVSFAEEEGIILHQTVETLVGKLQIRSGEESIERELLLDGKTLYKNEGKYLEVVQVFHTSNGEVVLLKENFGGSGTVDEHFFVQLRKGAAPVITPLFDSQGGRISAKQQGDAIVVDLGFDRGERVTLTYGDGKQTLSRAAPKTREPADESDCKYLYETIYASIVEDRQCDKDPEDVAGMSTLRAIRELENDPRLDLKALRTLSQKSCAAGKTIKYTAFKKKVCGG